MQLATPSVATQGNKVQPNLFPGSFILFISLKRGVEQAVLKADVGRLCFQSLSLCIPEGRGEDVNPDRGLPTGVLRLGIHGRVPYYFSFSPLPPFPLDRFIFVPPSFSPGDACEVQLCLHSRLRGLSGLERPAGRVPLRRRGRATRR